MADITSRLDGARNVLLAEPAMGSGRETCRSLLFGTADEPSVLFVTYTRDVDECLERVDVPADRNLGVISVGDARADSPGAAVEQVSTPGDLTGLGIRVGQFLSEWDPPVVVCFESLTAMLQYVDFETAYEFVHTVTGQIHAAGARAHFHIDPAAHDETVVAGFTSLFDAVVTPGDETTVRTRYGTA